MLFRSKGGSVTPAEGRLQKNFAAENKTAMKQAKAQSNEVYSKYQKKMAGGGAISDRDISEAYAIDKSFGDQIHKAARAARKGEGLEDMSNGAYDRHYATEKAENEAMRESILGAPKRLMQGVKNIFGSKNPSESVTKTKESVTVTPSKKRGGRC